MARPLIQIDNDGNSREMTEEEHAFYLEMWAQQTGLTDETPSPD
jgi:hypothetical protein